MVLLFAYFMMLRMSTVCDVVRDNWDRITDFTCATYPASTEGMLIK